MTGRRAARLAQTSLVTHALVVGRHPLGEADLIVRLFTESSGMLSAMARNARRSNKRFAALEPLHTLRVRVESSSVRELGTLVEAAFERPRIGITTKLVAMEAAGQALRWLKRAAPVRTPEPALWREINRLLDRLDGDIAAADVSACLATTGLRILAATGWAIELERCVRCNKPCPERARAIIDVAAGGIVCRHCGGRGESLSSTERVELLAAMHGNDDALCGGAARALELIERALALHGEGEAT
jgi:DNA repair protein RecO (recombination protein O)